MDSRGWWRDTQSAATGTNGSGLSLPELVGLKSSMAGDGGLEGKRGEPFISGFCAVADFRSVALLCRPPRLLRPATLPPSHSLFRGRLFAGHSLAPVVLQKHLVCKRTIL